MGILIYSWLGLGSVRYLCGSTIFLLCIFFLLMYVVSVPSTIYFFWVLWLKNCFHVFDVWIILLDHLFLYHVWKTMYFKWTNCRVYLPECIRPWACFWGGESCMWGETVDPSGRRRRSALHWCDEEAPAQDTTTTTRRTAEKERLRGWRKELQKSNHLKLKKAILERWRDR